MRTRGWTTIALTVAKPTPENPKGGTYDRLEKLLRYKKESWDEVVARLLDIYEAHPELHTDPVGKK
jgi:hypothetical protein